MPKKSLIERVIDSFDKDSNIILSENENKYRERLLFITEEKLKNLMVRDFELFKIVQKKYSFITFPQLCNDISIVERMIAVQKDPYGDSKKVWHRYFIVENAKKAYTIAEAKGDAYTMGFLLNIIGKHNLTDKEDIIKPPFDDIVPFIPEITSDPSILGINPIKDLNALKEKLRNKYNLDNRISEPIIISDESEN